MRWAVGAACCSGCSLAINADRVQCSTDADCQRRGGEFTDSVCVKSLCQASTTSPQKTHVDNADGGDAGPADAGPADLLWGCLDRPRVTSDLPGPFHITFHLAGILDPTPVQGASAKVCRKLDVDCQTPVATSQTDAMGNVTFDIDKGFTGYVTFEKSDIMTGLYFFNPPPDHDMASVAVQIVTTSIVDALTKSFMSPQKAENGLTLINAIDCDGKAAVGITFAAEGLDPGATEFYSVGGFPTSSAMATAMEGYGGFVNLPPGPLAVKGIIQGTKRELQTISVLIRASSITYARLAPIGR